MPRSFLTLIVFVAAAAGGYYFYQHYELDGLGGIKLKPKIASTQVAQGVPPVARSGEAIRIASFNIQVFGNAKADKPHVMRILADVVRRFDVVAIQEIRSTDDTLIPRFVDLVNSQGRKYNYVIGPRLGRTSSKEQYAYIFDMASIEVDRTMLYTVADPDGLLHRPPLVAWFRVRGPPEGQAFTFKLVNIHTDPDETDQELNALDNVFKAVREDGLEEDDVILLGDLNVDSEHLGELGRMPDVSWVIAGISTNTRGTKQYDNMVFSRRTTIEYMGRFGVFDLEREFNLKTEQALEVSDHLPIWAEFSIYENGRPERVADRPVPARRAALR